MPGNLYRRQRLEALLAMLNLLPGSQSRATEVGQARNMVKGLLDNQDAEIHVEIADVHFLREVLADVL